MKLLKNKKSFELGFQQIIIIIILLAFFFAIVAWYFNLKDKGLSFLTDFFKR